MRAGGRGSGWPAAVALAALLVLAPVLSPAPAAAKEPKVEIGVGRADITPPTGYFSMGYVRGDGLIEGALSRLWARVIVIRQGDEKYALIAQDLGAIPGGMLEHAIDRVADRGFSVENVIDSASHTHGGPAGMFNFSTYNTVFMTLNSPTDFQLAGGFDPQLYSFFTRRLATAIRRADRDLGPGRLGWGTSELRGVTVNRSLEAHLRNHGIELGPEEGEVTDDPAGAEHTIDTRVDVMRAEKRVGGRWMPVGMWSTYANHATINKYQFRYYNPDHHGAAVMYAERVLRRRGRVPYGQRIVNLYGNGAEGDMSAGLTRSGPAAAEHVGLREGRAMVRAWADAGGDLSRRPPIDARSTKLCFCGQQTSAGPVDDEPELGLAEFTGSDEARGPLYDVTRVSFEGRTSPVSSGPQGNKLIVDLPLDVPQAAPITVMQIGDRLIGTVPGEATKEAGVRIRDELTARTKGAGIKRVVVSGLVNEYLSYYTTPEEYSAGHYEGAATLYGQYATVALTDALGALATALTEGKPGPESYEFDQTNGIEDNGAPFPEGAEEATALEQPGAIGRRLGAVTFRWQGGPRGFDRPLDRAFVRIQRKQRHGKRAWKTVDKDIGLHVLWFVDDDGRYTARWEPGLSHETGTHRVVVAGRHYRLESEKFELRPLRSLGVEEIAAPAGRFAVELRYPPAVHREGIDDAPPDDTASLRYRPARVESGTVRFLVDGKPIVARSRSGRFEIDAPAGARIEVPAGAARDRWGNRNGSPVVLQG